MNAAPSAPSAGNAFAHGPTEVLTFGLQGEIFALEAVLVREILDRSPVTPVPGASPFVNAVINFRGRVIPLADLRLAFDFAELESTVDSRIIVIEFELEGEATLIGLRTDKVYEVTTIEPDSTEAAPRIGMRWRQDFIQCLVRRNDDVLVVPNLKQIFTARGRTFAGPVPAAPLN